MHRAQHALFSINFSLGVLLLTGFFVVQYWMLSKDGEIRRDESCVDFAGQEVMIFPCHGYASYTFESID